MKLNENAIKVLEKRYLIRDENGVPTENVEGLFRRVAKCVAEPDKDFVTAKELKKIENQFFNMMTDLEFLPNSPTLMNAGRPLGQLSACFVLPIEDTMEGIFDTIKNAALIHKSGGGTGFSFSRLRPKGATVNSTGGVASGPVSFMKVFNAATEAVKQGGTRRGANMGILRVDHPDILEFITAKQNNTEITNFNISVGITEKFMKAVKTESDYDLIDPYSKECVGKLSAKKMFDLMVEMSWNNGEPGIIFLDRLNKENVTPQLGEIESTNPCGEQPLLPFEACNLGSINLKMMVDETGDSPEVDFVKLGATVKKAVHFLDNVIDANKYPLPKIDEMTRGTRKIGLGVMGWADLLCILGIPYDSDEAIELADEVMGFINSEAKKASLAIAKKKGVFPYYNKSIFKKKKLAYRNATVTTIAPTGTLSIIAGVSSGIEPIFAISYIRNVMDNSELVEVNPIFENIAKEEGFYSEELMLQIAKEGTIREFLEIPFRVRQVFATAHDVSPEYHVKMQAIFQKHTDNAVSKTVNLSHEATMDDVRDVFLQAYETGCKGVTLYRDGSRDMQVLNIGSVKGKDADKTTEKETQMDCSSCSACGSSIDEGEQVISPRARPDITTGFTEKVRIGCGNLYITVNYDEKGICEVFSNLGRAGGCPSQSEATSRLVSIALRSGMDAQSIVEQLKGIRCPSTIRQKGMKVMSCPDAIGRLVEKVAQIQANGTGNNAGLEILASEKIVAKSAATTATKMAVAVSVENQRPVTIDYEELDVFDLSISAACPECGKKLEHEGGCVICRGCGFSKCG